MIAAFNDALRALGTHPTACESVEDPNEAHFIFWQWGDEAPVLSMRSAGTLLAGTAAALGPTTGGKGVVGGSGGGDVTPAVTGNAGLAAGLAEERGGALAVVAAAATVLLVLAARQSTSQRRTRSEVR